MDIHEIRRLAKYVSGGMKNYDTGGFNSPNQGLDIPFGGRYGDQDWGEYWTENDDRESGNWMPAYDRSRKDARQLSREINKRIRQGYVDSQGVDYSQFSKVKPKQFRAEGQMPTTFLNGGQSDDPTFFGDLFSRFQSWRGRRRDERMNQGSNPRIDNRGRLLAELASPSPEWYQFMVQGKGQPKAGQTYDDWWTSDGSTPGFAPDNRVWDGEKWVGQQNTSTNPNSYESDLLSPEEVRAEYIKKMAFPDEELQAGMFDEEIDNYVARYPYMQEKGYTEEMYTYQPEIQKEVDDWVKGGGSLDEEPNKWSQMATLFGSMPTMGLPLDSKLTRTGFLYGSGKKGLGTLSAISSGLTGARNFLLGFGDAKMREKVMDQYRADMKRTQYSPIGQSQQGTTGDTAQAAYGGMFGKGGLKEIPEDNKGLPLLPPKVREQMGYMGEGGMSMYPHGGPHDDRNDLSLLQDFLKTNPVRYAGPMSEAESKVLDLKYPSTASPSNFVELPTASDQKGRGLGQWNEAEGRFATNEEIEALKRWRTENFLKSPLARNPSNPAEYVTEAEMNNALYLGDRGFRSVEERRPDGTPMMRAFGEGGTSMYPHGGSHDDPPKTGQLYTTALEHRSYLLENPEMWNEDPEMKNQDGSFNLCLDCLNIDWENESDVRDAATLINQGYSQGTHYNLDQFNSSLDKFGIAKPVFNSNPIQQAYGGVFGGGGLYTNEYGKLFADGGCYDCGGTHKYPGGGMPNDMNMMGGMMGADMKSDPRFQPGQYIEFEYGGKVHKGVIESFDGESLTLK
jgi:hypothetical protein